MLSSIGFQGIGDAQANKYCIFKIKIFLRTYSHISLLTILHRLQNTPSSKCKQFKKRCFSFDIHFLLNKIDIKFWEEVITSF